jgi:hypothetical protein
LGILSAQTAPIRLGGVSYYWAVGEQQGGCRSRLCEVFSRSRDAVFSEKTGSASGRFKNIGPKTHWTKVLFAAVGTGSKIAFDYVIRRLDALSAGLKNRLRA